MRALLRIEITRSTLISSKNDALTALIHFGYLGYDMERKKAFIPNYEVATSFEVALQTGDWTEIARAIFAFIPRANAGFRPAMIVELKYNQSADSAIKQIKEKRYHGALSGYQDKILLVGINYDAEGKDNKHHTCVIEEWEN